MSFKNNPIFPQQYLWSVLWECWGPLYLFCPVMHCFAKSKCWKFVPLWALTLFAQLGSTTATIRVGLRIDPFPFQRSLSVESAQIILLPDLFSMTPCELISPLIYLVMMCKHRRQSHIIRQYYRYWHTAVEVGPVCAGYLLFNGNHSRLCGR